MSATASWDRLLTLAKAEVTATLTALPAPLRAQAEPLPVIYEPRPNRALVRDGCEPDLLGLFVGSELANPGESPIPSQILLFLENLWELAEGDEEFYRDELRDTYLHELGHYLGLDELDLEERDLD